MKRSLILAGGGVKVGFQAGVLQVWLDEAGLKFDHVDGASGGVFNLAMLCQGMTGRQIADNWRNIDPVAGIDFNGRELLKLAWAESIFTLDNYRRHVFTGWGLDWTKIRATPLDATFNVVNFSTKEIEVLEPKRMTEDFLCACVSLPMWFPPVRINGQTYIDAVYLTDANIEEAIRRGADELWIIWTVSDRDEWRDGFLANYFQIIETAAVGNYKAALKRIADNNASVARGERGLYGRHIEVKELKAEVPIHYLVNFSRDRMAETVNQGVSQARAWCAARGIPLTQHTGDYPTEVHTVQTRLWFTEEMKGFMTFGESDYDRAARLGRQQNQSLMFHLTITVNGVNRFVTNPAHDTDDVKGWIEAPALGGRLPVEKGWFNLFVDQQDPAVKRMLYRLFFRDSAGRELTLVGHKIIRNDPGFDVWTDTTTLFTRVLRGHVADQASEAAAELVASGIIVIHLTDFLRQLTTFRVEAPGGGLSDRAAAMARFGALFFGKLWDVYSRELLSWGPV